MAGKEDCGKEVRKVSNNKLYNVNSDIITNFLSRKIKIVPNKDWEVNN